MVFGCHRDTGGAKVHLRLSNPPEEETGGAGGPDGYLVDTAFSIPWTGRGRQVFGGDAGKERYDAGGGPHTRKNVR